MERVVVEKVEAESVMVVWVLVMSGDRGGGHGEGGGNDGEGGSGDHEVGCEVGDSEVGDGEVGDGEVGDDADRLGIMVNRCDDNRGDNNC